MRQRITAALQYLARKVVVNTIMDDKIIDYGFLHDLSHEKFQDLKDHVAVEMDRRGLKGPEIDEHEHVWTQGMAPGNKHIRICKLCGITEDVEN